jgi:hypothetical protein
MKILEACALTKFGRMESPEEEILLQQESSSETELFVCGVMEMKWILVREEEAGKGSN